MLMIGTGELAKRLYTAWRNWTEVHGATDSVPPRWDHLTTNQQAHWRFVAEEGGRAVAEAISGPNRHPRDLPPIGEPSEVDPLEVLQQADYLRGQ